MSEIELTDKDKKEMVELMRRKFGNELTDTEFRMLVYLADKYDLDPIKNEIFAIKFKDYKTGEYHPATFGTGRDGFLKIAHKTGQFAAMETYAVTTKGEIIDTCLNVEDLAGAQCRVWRKDSDKPTVVTLPLREYMANNKIWKSIPETMIKKCAEAAALRRAFNIGGLYLKEELDRVIEGERVGRQIQINEKNQNQTIKRTEMKIEKEENIKENANENISKSTQKSKGKHSKKQEKSQANVSKKKEQPQENQYSKKISELPKAKVDEIKTALEGETEKLANLSDGKVEEILRDTMIQLFQKEKIEDLTVNEARSLFNEIVKERKLLELQSPGE